MLTKSSSSASPRNLYPSVGTVLAGRYELKSLIAVGGMGAVFRAVDSFLRQPVAIKVLLIRSWDSSSPAVRKALADLRSEARASIKLTHKNIVRVYNYERDGDWEFLVMEYVSGRDLRRLRKDQGKDYFPVEQVVAVGKCALDALAHAHAMHVSHHDIKPANILVADSGDIKLCDFGLSALARLVGQERSDGTIAGTAAYVSPEMVNGKKVDHRADLYSLSATLYELLSGRPPFGTHTPGAYMGHVNDPVPDDALIPPGLMSVLRRGMEKDPALRFQSARQMLTALAQADLSFSSDGEESQDGSSPTLIVDLNVGALDAVEVGSPGAPSKPASPSTRAGKLKVSRLSYDLKSKSWSEASFPSLDSDRTLVLAFGAPEFFDKQDALLELARAYPKSKVVGCSSSGEIHGTDIRDESLSVAIAKFEKTTLATATVKVSDASHSYGAGESLGRKLKRADLRAVLVLSEGLSVNGSELVRGFNSVLDESVVVTGGLSGDGTRFERTWVFGGGRVESGMVVAVGLYGDHVTVGHGSKGGWDRFGQERTVTRSEANVLYELDGRPALDLYKQYLGDKASGLPATGLLFPLSMRSHAQDDKYLVRTLLAVDEEAKSMTFAGDVPQGSLVQLMKANFERLIGGAEGAALVAEEIREKTSGSDTLAVAVSCVGRRLVLGDRTEEEVEAVLEVLPPGSVLTGFYSYGELSPFATGSCDLHNQTMTLTVFSESSSPLPRRAKPSAPSKAPVAKTNGKTNGHANGRPASTSTVRPPAPGRPSTRPSTRAGKLKVSRLSYDLKSKSWSEASFPSLDSDRTLVLAFGAPEFFDKQDALLELARAYPKSKVVGCSSSGEIHGTDIRDESLSVAIAKFEKTTLATATVKVSDASHSYGAGESLGRKLKRADLRAVLVLSEGLSVNGSELVRGFNSVLDESVVVTGGLSGDGTRFERTWVFGGGRVESGMVVAVGLYGDHVTVGHGSKGGWDRFGQERTVTRSEANVLYELDGRPALDLYKQYLGDKASGLPATGLLFPLSMRSHAQDDKYLVRTLLAVDEEAKSMTFAGDVPQGSLVQLMKANFERLIGGAEGAALVAEEIREKTSGSDTLAVAVSCVGRRLVLGDRTEEEVEAVLEVLPPGSVLTGFYSYGELSPFATGSCDLHNQTMTLTVFSESSSPLPRRAKPSAPSKAPVAKTNGKTNGHANGRPASTSTVRPPAPGRSSQAAPPTPAQTSTTPPPFDPLPPQAATPIPPPPSREDYGSAASAPPLMGVASPSADVDIDVEVIGGVNVVTLGGKLNESFQGAALGRRLQGDVIFDLARVERVTSFGVREWLQMIGAMKNARYSLTRCSEAIVNQLSMIRSFAGEGQVVSFYAPYRCDDCGNGFDVLVDCEEHAGVIKSKQAPEMQCTHCRETATFDDDPNSYFAFADRHAGTPVSSQVRKVLAKLADAPDGEGEIDPISKTVEGRTTRIRVGAALDGSLRWQRVLEGVEGEVVLDLSRVSEVKLDGSNNLVRALHTLGSEVNEIGLEGCPRAVLEALSLSPSDRIKVVSARLRGRCGSCDALRSELVQFSGTDIRNGWEPYVPCRRCNTPLSFQDAEAVLRSLFQAYEGGAPSIPAASPSPVDQDGYRVPPAMWAVVAILSAILVAAGAAFVGSRLGQSERDSDVREGKAVAPVAQDPASLAASAPPPKAKPRDLKSEIPPEWTERPFVVEEDTVVLVGRSEPSPEVDAALKNAHDQAIQRLASEMLRRLAGTRYYDFAQERLARPLVADANVLASRVARRYLDQFGHEASPRRAELFVRERENGKQVFGRYELAREAFEEAVETYRSDLAFRGFRAATFAPSLEAVSSPESNVFIYEVRRGSPADHVGLREGDSIVAINGRRVSSIGVLRELIGAELNRNTRTKTIALSVEAQGVHRTVRLRHAAR